jgi:hypothetical protein
MWVRVYSPVPEEPPPLVVGGRINRHIRRPESRPGGGVDNVVYIAPGVMQHLAPRKPLHRYMYKMRFAPSRVRFFSVGFCLLSRPPLASIEPVPNNY